MSSLVIPPTDWLKTLLPVDGDFTLDVPAWAKAIRDNTPLDPAKHDAPVSFSLRVGTGQPTALLVGGATQLTLALDASATVQLDPIWKKDELAAGIPALAMDEPFFETARDDTNLYLGLKIEAAANVTLGAAAPIGALTLGIDAKGGATCTYQRFLPYARTRPATQVLLDYFSTLRSPLHVGPVGSPVLAEGEIVTFAFNGTLAFGLRVGAGYSVAGLAKIDAARLAPSLRYNLQTQAEATLRFSATGGYKFTLAPASLPGWVRLILNKQSSTGREFGLGAKLEFTGGVENLPEKPEAIIQSLFGYDPAGAMEIVEAIAGYPNLPAALAALSNRYVPELMERISAPLTDLITQKRIASFVAISSSLRARALELLARNGLDAATLISHLSAMASADSLKTLLGPFLPAPAAGSLQAFLLKEFGDDVMDWFENEHLFKEFQAIAGEMAALLGGQSNPLVEIARRLPTPKDIQSILDALGAPGATPASVSAAINGILSEHAEALLGKIWTRFAQNPAAGEAWDTLQDSAKSVLKVRDYLGQKLKQARNLQAEASIGLAFGVTTERTALLDLELDTTTEAGRSLLKHALQGNFEPILAEADQGISVRLRAGRLTRARNAASNLTIAVPGWSFTRSFTVSQLEAITVQQGANGLLYLISTTTAFEEVSDKKHRDEIEHLSTRFHILATTEATQKDRFAGHFLRVSLRHVGVGYAVTQSDTQTNEAELLAYLEFADSLGVFGKLSSHDFLQQLIKAHPRPWAVKLEYVVKYRPDALTLSFNEFGDEKLRQIARTAVRRFFADRYLKRNNKPSDHHLIAAYLTAERIVARPKMQNPRRVGPSGPCMELYVPHTETPKRYYNDDHHDLERFIEEESAFLDAIAALANVVNGHHIDPARLDRAARRFVEVAHGKPRFFGSRLWRDNVFFLVVDALISAADMGGRESALHLKLTSTAADGTTAKHDYVLSV